MASATFRTEDGVGVSAVTAAQMRAVDRVATEDVGLGLLQMMENAGRTLASHVLAAGAGPVVVLAGNGGNGGGGLACARHLANRGVDVSVVLDRRADDLSGAAARQFRILAEMDVETAVGLDGLDAVAPANVYVDALIGYGLSGPVRDPASRMIEAVNRTATPIVSVDLPSGLDATSGETRGASIKPTRTVTLALPKTGLAGVSGDLFLADIGIPSTGFDRLDIEYESPFRSEAWVEVHSEQSVTD
jgi:NAD(P)H-hydrate epimerase